MRAFDKDKERFSDFVLSRIEKISLKDCDAENIPEDIQWSSFIQLELQPDPELSKRQKERLQIEYDMKNGLLSLEVREAMLFYYLRFYGFDPRRKEKENGTIRNESSFLLNIVNIQEIDECIGRRS